MKKSLSFGLGMTYAGSFLGAGYVSGQELWQYFGRYGVFGIIGLLLTMLLFLFLGYVLYRLVSKTKIDQMDNIVVLNSNKVFLRTVSVLQILNFISIYIIMIAGVSAMFETVFDLSKYITALLCSVLVVALAIGGITGLVRVFSVTIPILTVFAVIISVLAVIKGGYKFDFTFTQEHGFAWIFASLVYMSFNFFGVIGIMAPVYSKISDKTTAKRGILIGTVMLFLIAISVLSAITVNNEFSSAELPMLDISFSINTVSGILYSLLLLFAMVGTALSSLVASDNFLKSKIEVYNKKRIPFLILIAAICYFFSLIGFSSLIGTVYPIFGIAGFFAIVTLVVNYFTIRSK